MKNLTIFLFAFILFSCGAKTEKKEKTPIPSDTSTVQTKPTVDRSYLKKRPEEFNEFFMLTDVIPFTGKIATKKDVEKKAAVFNLNSKKDPSHKPLNIRLPFYAFLLQPNNQASKFVAIIQAETLKGDTILGYKEANGLFGICNPRELEYFELQKNNVYTTPQ